ncbi:MAG: hypothetical protein KIT87_04215 [Anaerolineae bacterium]|nr:hypothetical protein [Anaerolineae bacterium]
MSAALAASDRAALRQFMADRFNMADLTEICFDLSLDVEEFPRATKSQFCQELIGYFERKGNLACLLVEILKRRADDAMGRLLGRIGGCEARKKVQLILSNDVVVKPEIKAALAQLLGVSLDEVAIMGKVTGSTRLLVGLPGPAADRLLALEVSLLAGKYRVISVQSYATLSPLQQIEWRRVVGRASSGGIGRGGAGSAPPPSRPPYTGGPGGDDSAGDGHGGRGCLGWLLLLVVGVVVGGGLLWGVINRLGIRLTPTPTPDTGLVRPTQARPTPPPPVATPTPTLLPRRPTPTNAPPPPTDVPLAVKASAAPDPVCYGECGNRPTRVTVRAEVQGADSPKDIQAVTLEYRYRSTSPNLPAGAWRKAAMQPAAGSGVYTVVVDVGREAYPDLRGTQGVFEFQVVALDSSGQVAQSKTDTVRVEYLIG